MDVCYGATIYTKTPKQLVWGLQRLCTGRNWRYLCGVDSASATYAPHTTVGALNLPYSEYGKNRKYICYFVGSYNDNASTATDNL